MNQPYVKQYTETGEVANPITGHYIQPFPNRSARKESRARMWGGKSPKVRFMGNGKNFSLSVYGKLKYARRIQEVIDNETGKTKRIEHYDLKGKNY